MVEVKVGGMSDMAGLKEGGMIMSKLKVLPGPSSLGRGITRVPGGSTV